MSIPIFVGYSLKVIDDIASLVAPVVDETNAADVAAHEKALKKLQDHAGDNVYLSSLDRVVMTVRSGKLKLDFDSAESKSKVKVPVCVQVQKWLLENFPNAWSPEVHAPYGLPAAYFIGFNPRRFVKTLGIDCSLPVNDVKLAAGVWFSNSDHRNIEEAAMPSTESKHIDWPVVFAARRRGLKGKDLARHDALINGWFEAGGPGIDPERDVKIAMMLAGQLRFTD